MFRETDFEKYLTTIKATLTEMPPVLYKYRDWDREFNRDLIIKQEIMFASPNNLNDVFECDSTFCLTESAKNEEYFDLLVRELQVTKGKPEYQVQQIKQKLRERIFREGDTAINSFLEGFREALEKEFGIVSLTRHPDNITMWSYYSNSHKGFCVGFDSKKLLNSGNFGVAQKVQYIDKKPKIVLGFDIPDQINKMFFTKHSEWKHEDEYRCVLQGGANKILTIPKEIFSEVIIGYAMNLNDQNQLVRSVKEQLPHVKLFKVKKQRDEYRLLIEPFNQ